MIVFFFWLSLCYCFVFFSDFNWFPWHDIPIASRNCHFRFVWMWWNVFTIASNSYKHDIAPIILLHKIIALSTSTVIYTVQLPACIVCCVACMFVNRCARVSFYLHSPHGLTIKATRACVWFHLIGKCLLQMNVGLCIVKMIKAACECANQISTWTINWCNLWTKAAVGRRSDFQCSGNLHSHLLNTIKSSSERIREYGIHKWNYLTSCSLHQCRPSVLPFAVITFRNRN